MTSHRRAGFIRNSGSAIAVVSLVAASPCIGMPALSCSGSLQPMQRIELMFGRNIRGHLRVGDAAWARFLAREITPRFPGGLTVLDAAGQWRDPADGRVVREPSKLVIVVTVGDASLVDDRIAAVTAAYKQRFRQKSVGVVTSPACAAF
jgi:Protein of unknown function (DUF3574)